MWSLLSVVAEEERRDLRHYLHRALEVWSKQGKLTQPLVRTVCSHTANKQHEKVSRTFLGAGRGGGGGGGGAVAPSMKYTCM